MMHIIISGLAMSLHSPFLTSLANCLFHGQHAFVLNERILVASKGVSLPYLGGVLLSNLVAHHSLILF